MAKPHPLDAFFLEALAYQGSMTSSEMIVAGLEKGIDSDSTSEWIINAAERNLIARILDDEPGEVWRIAN